MVAIENRENAMRIYHRFLDVCEVRYQLLHRILPINYHLHRVGIVNSPLCYFCQQTPENIKHNFVDCYLVKEIGLIWRNG